MSSSSSGSPSWASTAIAAAMSSAGTSLFFSYAAISSRKTPSCGSSRAWVIASVNFATRLALTSSTVGSFICVSVVRLAFSMDFSR